MIALSDLKAWLRVDGTEQDALIAQLETRAVATIERLTGRYFGVPAARIEFLDGSGGDVLMLAESALAANPGHVPPIPAPVIASWDGTTYTTVATTDYTLDGGFLYHAISTWPYGRRNLRATYWAGYDAGAEPGPIRQAVLHLVGHWFENRETVEIGTLVSDLPLTVKDLVGSYRPVRV